MSLIIDGYNLLHVAGVFGEGRRGGSLHRSREALLRFVAASLEASQRSRTTIVFDAAEAPPGLPQRVMYEEMTVRYAANYADADALIEELIAADYSPRSLLVVSSDHRIQRAARRRRAAFRDSDLWFAEIVRKRERRRKIVPRAARPSGPLAESEVAYWLAEFDVDPADATLDPLATRPAETPPTAKPASGEPADRRATDQIELPLDNPFPPGYAEDLFEDED